MPAEEKAIIVNVSCIKMLLASCLIYAWALPAHPHNV